MRLLLLPILAIAGCSPQPEPYEAVADIQQLMVSVIEPAADHYWDSVGTVMTIEGTEEIAHFIVATGGLDDAAEAAAQSPAMASARP